MDNIKIFSDFACPFCYIGLAIAEKLKEEDPDLNIEWIPYELDENVPLEGNDVADSIPQDQIAMVYRRIERLGSEYNLKYNNKTKKFNTTRLHKAALFARNEGKYYEFAREAFKAIFEDGKNVGEAVVVNDIGLKAGLNIVEMNRCIDDGAFDEEMEESKNLSSIYEIESVPTFIVDNENHVTTLKDYERFKKDLMKK